MNDTAKRILMLLISLVIPFFLVMTAIRILFTPAFVQLQYRAPGFPEDLYGFTLEDRLHWSRVSLDYLLNDSGIAYLADQRLPDGSPLYNERELVHMVDVKVLVKQMMRVWAVLLVVFIGLALWAWRGHLVAGFLRALSNGGKLTLALIALVLVFVVISFRQLFTYFHQIFFTGDSWLFSYSDTLIRLFPLPFWQNGFIAMGALTIGGALGLIWLDRFYRNRK